MHIVSKSAFARLCNVQPSAVSNWITNGILGGEAIVGEGRTARINVDVARVQVNQRRDIGQALGNGLKVRLRPDAPPAVAPPGPAETCTIPDAQTARRLFFEGVLCLAYDLPQAIALGAYDAGTPRAEAERIEIVVRDGIQSEVGLLARLYGPQDGLTFADLFDETRFLLINWDAVEADRDEAP